MTPTTPTGKRLLDDLEDDPYALPDILAIEAEAAAQERERLRARLDMLPRFDSIRAPGAFMHTRDVLALLADPEP
jgi:hypothetical protein